ncbi:hypothetical protein [Streptomyces violarus]|uniref:hypothetical protein n=1 Tax=Streptomyces violarus TaxID=67380 RepID=UPI0021BE206F|nr:hypothetical protein [Streptomyces violarus]MCT9137639.1 hypothetical protein [Streptomyces violarus]
MGLGVALYGGQLEVRFPDLGVLVLAAPAEGRQADVLGADGCDGLDAAVGLRGEADVAAAGADAKATDPLGVDVAAGGEKRETAARMSSERWMGSSREWGSPV